MGISSAPLPHCLPPPTHPHLNTWVGCRKPPPLPHTTRCSGSHSDQPLGRGGLAPPAASRDATEANVSERRMPPARAESEEERRPSLPAAAAGPVPAPSSLPLALVRTFRPGHQALKGEGGEAPLGGEAATTGAAGGEVPGEAPALAPLAVLPLEATGPSTLPLAACCSAAAAVPLAPRTGLSSGSGGRPPLASLLPMVMGCVALLLLVEACGLLSAASAASAASLAGPLEEPRRAGGRPCGAASDQAALVGLVPSGVADVGDAPTGALASPPCCACCCCCARVVPPLPPPPAVVLAPVPPSRFTRLWCSWEGDSRLRWPGVGVADRELRRLAVGEPPSGELPRGLPPSGDRPAKGRGSGRMSARGARQGW